MIRDVLFKCREADPLYRGQILTDKPFIVVLCGACGKGICLPIVNQQCSAACGAYVFEVKLIVGTLTATSLPSLTSHP